MSNVVGIKFNVTAWTILPEVISCCWDLKHCQHYWKWCIFSVGELLSSCSELPSENMHQSYFDCKTDIASPRRNTAFPAVLLPITICKAEMGLFTFVGACVVAWQLLGPWAKPCRTSELEQISTEDLTETATSHLAARWKLPEFSMLCVLNWRRISYLAKPF